MKESLIEYLCCPLCRSSLELTVARRLRKDVRSGKLLCNGCGQSFPVVAGRPVMLKAGMVDSWMSPIDEVLGTEDPVVPPLSVPRLVEMGVDAALEAARRNDANSHGAVAAGEEYVPRPSAVSAMRYRASGRWFDAGDRRQRLLDFRGRLPETFREFMAAVEATRPEVLLDLASGGGFGVSHQAYGNRFVKQVMAIERDLKCLGNIQYRFRCAGAEDRAEAIGGDVRMLPVVSGCVDTVMMLQALPEIGGISTMLQEIRRVLKSGGRFVLEVFEEPFTGGLIDAGEMARFARETDLYAGYENFLARCEEAGLKELFSKGFAGDESGGLRLIGLMKR